MARGECFATILQLAGERDWAELHQFCAANAGAAALNFDPFSQSVRFVLFHHAKKPNSPQTVQVSIREVVMPGWFGLRKAAQDSAPRFFPQHQVPHDDAEDQIRPPASPRTVECQILRLVQNHLRDMLIFVPHLPAGLVHLRLVLLELRFYSWHALGLQTKTRFDYWPQPGKPHSRQQPHSVRIQCNILWMAHLLGQRATWEVSDRGTGLHACLHRLVEIQFDDCAAE